MAQSTNIGAPAECNLERRRADTKDVAIRLTQDGVAIASAAGYSGILTVNTAKEPNINVSPVVGVQVYQTTGVPNSPATDAILRFDFSSFDSSPEVPPGSYFYDIQITDPDGKVSTPLIGKFIVKQDITK
jgi:hypothetical protein